jgi:hypothetical protein
MRLLPTAENGWSADRLSLASAVGRGGPAWRGGHASRRVGTAALALLSLIAACGSAAGAPPARIPARASLFRTIPAACSLVNASTASLLGLNAKGQQFQPTAREPGVTEEYCQWVSDSGDPSGPSPGGPSRFNLLVIVDLFTAATGQQAPAAAAQSQLQESVSEQEQADNSRASPVAGLANGAFMEHVARAGISESQLQARDQNVLVTVTYAGNGTEASINNQALTAARAILAGLAAS